MSSGNIFYKNKGWDKKWHKPFIYLIVCLLVFITIILDYYFSVKEDKIHTLKLVIMILLFLSYFILTFYQFRSKFLEGFLLCLTGTIITLCISIHYIIIEYFEK